MGTWWDKVLGSTDLSRFVGLGSVLGKSSFGHVLPFMGQYYGFFLVWAMNAYIGTELVGSQLFCQALLLIPLSFRLV